jgi:hypothetical protein
MGCTAPAQQSSSLGMQVLAQCTELLVLVLQAEVQAAQESAQQAAVEVEAEHDRLTSLSAQLAEEQAQLARLAHQAQVCGKHGACSRKDYQCLTACNLMLSAGAKC